MYVTCMHLTLDNLTRVLMDLHSGFTGAYCHRQTHRICRGERISFYHQVSENNNRICAHMWLYLPHCDTDVECWKTTEKKKRNPVRVCQPTHVYSTHTQQAREKESASVCPSILVVPGAVVCRNAGDG